MTPADLKALQKPLKERYREDPDAGRCTMRVTADLVPETLSCRVPPRGDRVLAGLHALAGGNGDELCSADILLESLAACAGVTLCAVATALGIELRSGQVTAFGDLDFRGTLGVAREVPIGMQNFGLDFELETDADADTLERLRELAERYCVIYQTLQTSNPANVTVRKRGSA